MAQSPTSTASTKLDGPLAIEIDGYPLKPEELLVEHLTYEDALGRLFEMHLDLLSPRADLDMDRIVGARVTVEIAVAGQEARVLSGHVSQFVQAGHEGGLHGYRATVVPWLWFLTLTSDCRIFQNQTVPDIVKAVLGEENTADFSMRVSPYYQPVEYCVQYRETDFQFVSRLMEREGIYYYFTHTRDAHKMVLTDSGADPAVDKGQFPHRDGRDAGLDGHLWSWTYHRRVRPGRTAVQSYDFTAPRKNLQAKGSAVDAETLSDREMFDYSMRHVEVGEGERQAKMRTEEWHVRQTLATAMTNTPDLQAGTVFELSEHARADLEGRKYRVVATRFEHRHSDPSRVKTKRTAEETRVHGRSRFGRLRPSLADSAFAAAREHRLNEPLEPALAWPHPPVPSDLEEPAAPFECELLLMPQAIKFRPERVTPRPIISGPQTAVVGGEPGEVVSPDKYGRVKVTFHWDRYPAENNHSTLPVRVSQNWAGKNYGTMFLPHGGQEVIVEFLEGDPDRPIITGRVYNEDNMPPLDLPARKHETVVARDHFGNEIILDATPGDENIRLYSPSHESAIVLGRSISASSQSDSHDFEVGNTNKTTLGSSNAITVGAKHELTAGVQAGETIGAKFEANLGSFNSATVGQKFEFSLAHSASVVLGTSWEYKKGPHVENSDSSILSMADVNNVVAAKLETRLVTGAGPGLPTSMVSSKPGQLELAAGLGQFGIVDATSPGKALLAANLAGLLAGVAAGASAALAGAATGKLLQKGDGWQTDENGNQKKGYWGDSFHAGGGIAAAAVLGVTGIGLAVASGLSTIPLLTQQEAVPCKGVAIGGSSRLTLLPASAKMSTDAGATYVEIMPTGIYILGKVVTVNGPLIQIG